MACRFRTAAAWASGVGRLGHALVDHGAEILPGQLCQIHELLLSDIPQEGGDLGVVDNARQGIPCPAAKISAWSRMDTTACIRLRAPMMVPAPPASSRK